MISMELSLVFCIAGNAFRPISFLDETKDSVNSWVINSSQKETTASHLSPVIRFVQSVRLRLDAQTSTQRNPYAGRRPDRTSRTKPVSMKFDFVQFSFLD